MTTRVRDLQLEEIMELWLEMEWWRKWHVLLAMCANNFMRNTVELVRRKRIAGYIIITSLLLSIIGFIFFMVQGDALGSGVFGLMVGIFAMFSIYWLVWRYLR